MTPVTDCANEARLGATDGWRTESSTIEEHSNPYDRAVRKKLWTEPRLTIDPLESRMVKIRKGVDEGNKNPSEDVNFVE